MEYSERKGIRMQQLKQSLNKLFHSRSFLFIVIFFVITAFVPLIVGDNFFLTVMTLIVIFAIYAASWNFLANSGQGSLGHAVFLGIGGFASAIIGSSISKATANFLGLSQMPIGGLSVAILILALLLGGFAFSWSWINDRFSLYKIEGMVSSYGNFWFFSYSGDIVKPI